MKLMRTTEALLTVIAVLLALHLVAGRAPAPVSAAGSQPRPDSEAAEQLPFNAGAQRVEMIQRLGAIDARLGAIEATLDAGLKVRVVEMPPVVIREDPAAKREREERERRERRERRDADPRPAPPAQPGDGGGAENQGETPPGS